MKKVLSILQAFVAFAVMLLCLLTAGKSYAVDAGKVIQNQALIDYAIAGVSGHEVQSNTINLVVDRALAVAVESIELEAVNVFPQKENAVLRFRVTNLSNATTDILLSANKTSAYTDSNGNNTLHDFDLNNTDYEVFVDDGDGLYEITSDKQQFIDNINAGESALVFIVADIPTDYPIGDLSALNLIAQVAEPANIGEVGLAITQDDSGHLSPAGIFESGETTNNVSTSTVSKNDNLNAVLDVFVDGKGSLIEDRSTNNGQDVVFNGQHSDTAAFFGVALPVELVKSAEIIDPEGGSEPYEGATIRYTLSLRTLSDAENVVVSDVIPSGTTYINNTLLFDGVVLSDASDAGATNGDNGDFDETQPNAVYVDLGDVPQNSTHRISFDVTIN